MEIPDIYKDAILIKTSPVIMKTVKKDKDGGEDKDKDKDDKDKDSKDGEDKDKDSKDKPDVTDDVEPFPLDADGNPIKTQMLDANGNPMTDEAGNPIYVGKDGRPIYVDSDGNPIAMNMVGQTTSISSVVKVDSDSEEHKLILEKEKVIEDLIRQYHTQQQQQQQQHSANGSGSGSDGEDKDQNVAVDFFLKMVKTYFALVLKFGDTVANAVIRMTMPSQIADPIISNNPLNIADLVKTADRVNQVLANPEFKSELGYMFDNTSNAVNPQIKMLLNKFADIILEVGGKTGSKLASTAAVTLSAFPPFAPIFAIADLITVGISAVKSGVSMVSTAANSGSKVLGAFNDSPSVDINKYMANTVDPSKKITGPKGSPPTSPPGSPPTSPPGSPPTSPPGSPPGSPSNKKVEANKVGTNKVGTNKVEANKVGTNKVGTNKVGGGIKEVGDQFVRDIGFGSTLDYAKDAYRKTTNVVSNVKYEITPVVEGWIVKYTKDPKQQGGKKTRRRRINQSIHRINQTMKDFHETNKVKKTKRKK